MELRDKYQNQLEENEKLNNIVDDLKMKNEILANANKNSSKSEEQPIQDLKNQNNLIINQNISLKNNLDKLLEENNVLKNNNFNLMKENESLKHNNINLKR